MIVIDHCAIDKVEFPFDDYNIFNDFDVCDIEGLRYRKFEVWYIHTMGTFRTLYVVLFL